MSEEFINLNENELASPGIFSPLKINTSGLHLLTPSMNSNIVMSSHSSIPDSADIITSQIDPRYSQFIEQIERRDANPDEYVPSIDDQELVASILYDFHHFKILIRSQKRLEFSRKLFKYIKIGYLDRGEFFFHRGDSNKTDLICILSGKAAVF